MAGPSIAALLLVLIVATATHRLPGWIWAWHAAASLLCFALYAADKSAAQAGRWRTPESTLLTFGLIGGWPGAIAAHHLLRHKSVKPSFRAAFHLTVVVQPAALVWWRYRINNLHKKIQILCFYFEKMLFFVILIWGS